MRRTLSTSDSFSRKPGVRAHPRVETDRTHSSSETVSTAVTRTGSAHSSQSLQQRGSRYKRYRQGSSSMASSVSNSGVPSSLNVVGTIADPSLGISHNSHSIAQSSDRSVSQAQSHSQTINIDPSAMDRPGSAVDSTTMTDSTTMPTSSDSSIHSNSSVIIRIKDRFIAATQLVYRIMRQQWISLLSRRISSLRCCKSNNSSSSSNSSSSVSSGGLSTPSTTSGVKSRMIKLHRLRVIDCFFVVFLLSVLFVGLSHNLVLNRLLSAQNGSFLSSIIRSKPSDSIMSSVPTYSLKNPNEYLFISGVPANITSLHHSISEDKIGDMCRKIARSNSRVSYVVRDSRLYLTDVSLDKKKNHHSKHLPHSLFIRSFSTFRDLSLSFKRTYQSAPRFSHDFDLIEQSMFSLSHPSIPDLSGLDACCHVLTLDGSHGRLSHHSRYYHSRSGNGGSVSHHNVGDSSLDGSRAYHNAPHLPKSRDQSRLSSKESRDESNNHDDLAGLPPLTVVINTWRREKCLLRVISHWSECPAVHKLVVVSADPKTEERWQNYPKLVRLLRNGQITVGGKRVDIHSATLGNNRLTDRFVFDPAIMSDVLFPIDDDIYYDCDFITDALRLYAALNMGKSTQDRTVAVGFEPRTFRVGYVDKSVQKKFDKHDSYFFVRERHNTCAYNGVWLTLGGIVHKEYFLAFQSQRMMDVRASVNGNITAEDIAMSLLYSSMNHGMPPVALAMNPTQVKTLACTQSLSATMHSNKDRKRKDITFDAMRSLGLTERRRSLKASSVFVTTEDHFRHQSLYHHSEESSNEFYRSRNPLDVF